MTKSEFDKITEKLGRLFNALEQTSERLEELMEVTAASRALIVNLQAGLTFEEEDPNGASEPTDPASDQNAPPAEERERKLAESAREREPGAAPSPHDPSTFLNGDYEWTQTADVLPHEGETVLARWIDGVMNWTYYRKSVEYPGAFCFYDQFGKAVTAPKEWLSPRTERKEAPLPESPEQSADPAPAPQEAAE